MTRAEIVISGSLATERVARSATERMSRRNPALLALTEAPVDTWDTNLNSLFVQTKQDLAGGCADNRRVPIVVKR